MFKPTEDRIVLKPIPPDTKTKSGLIIPIESQKVKIWEVVSVGPQSENKFKVVDGKVIIIPVEINMIRPGMIVLIPEAAGFDYEDDGHPLRCIRHSSIELFDEKK